MTVALAIAQTDEDSKETCTGQQMLALHRAYFSNLERTDLWLEERSTLLIGIALAQSYLFKHCPGDAMSASTYAAHHMCIDPDFSRLDFTPLCSLASTIKDQDIKAVVRALAIMASNMPKK